MFVASNSIDRIRGLDRWIFNYTILICRKTIGGTRQSGPNSSEYLGD